MFFFSLTQIGDFWYNKRNESAFGKELFMEKHDGELGKGKGSLWLLLATLLLTVGIYLAYPARGLAATLPLLFLFAIAAVFLWQKPLWLSLLGGGVSLFYGLFTDLTDPFLFAVFSSVTILLAGGSVKGFCKGTKEKKKPFLLLAILCTLLGLVLPLFYTGSPMAYKMEEKEVNAYLAETYPDQEFHRITLYRNAREKGYEVRVTYPYESAELESSLFFGTQVKDGFLEDFSLRLQEKRKAELIPLLKEADFSPVVDASGIAEQNVFHGSYGEVGEEMKPLFHFSLTFREELPARRDFAQACGKVHRLLKENGFDYKEMTFYALDAGNVVYACTLTPETQEENILSMVHYPY